MIRKIVVVGTSIVKNFILKIISQNRIKIYGIALIGHECKIAVRGEKGRVTLNHKCDIKEYSRLEAVNGEITLGKMVFINRNATIVSMSSISIGDNSTIGPNFVAYDHDHDYKSGSLSNYISKPISIGSNVWIGANCTVLKGVSIGDNCIVAAGTVVYQDIPNNSVVYQKRDTLIKNIE